jgi:diacylglycerol kinase family enzyme/membrane-associated phospholipid phosphatase
MSDPVRARRTAKLVVVRQDAPPRSRPRRASADAAPRRIPEPGRNGAPALDLLIVHNPASTRFTHDAMRDTAAAVLGARGLKHRLVAIPDTRDAERSVRRQVARAIREGCLRIVAAGGDGTIGMVAQCLARRRSGPPVSLGIIPAGTTNVLARELGIPLRLEDAMTVIADAERAIAIDAILAGRRYIFTQVGIGPDALMIRDTPRERQEKIGRLAYLLTFAQRAVRFRPRWFTLTLDGQVIRERAWQLVAANVGAIGSPPFTWGPRIDPTDGTLDLCVFNVRRRRDLVRLAWRFLTNRHRRDENARFYRVRDRVVVDSAHPVLVQGDGEIIGQTPVTLRIVPGALRVLVARAVEGTLPAPAPAAETAAASSATPDAAAPPAPADDGARATGGSSLPAAADATEEPAAAWALAPPAETEAEAEVVDAHAESHAPAASVGEDVVRMIGERSRTWPLQGRFRHPLAALEAYDAAIFLRLNCISLGDAVDRSLELISRFIHYGEGWAAVVLLMLLVDLRRGLEAAVQALPALWATMITVNVVLKRVFRRRRPFIAFVKARVIGPRPRDFSFPSGHAAAGFAGAVLLSMFAPAWAPIFFLFALAVSFSRIYLGVHYPSDVAMGAFSGMILAVVFHALIQMLLGGM